MSADQQPKKTRGRPRTGQYGAGGGAPKLSARIEEQEILDWVKSFPGGTAGVLRAAYRHFFAINSALPSRVEPGAENKGQDGFGQDAGHGSGRKGRPVYHDRGTP